MIPNGVYLYYVTATSTVPIVCEVLGNAIALVGEPGWHKMPTRDGQRFIRLVPEQAEAESEGTIILDANVIG